MKYTTKMCPHCKHPYEHYSSVTKGTHFGSPFIKCRNCGKTFIDSEMEELALKPYSETQKRYSPLRLIAGLWNIFTVCFVLLTYVIFGGHIEYDASIAVTIFFFVFYGACGLFTLNIIKTITIDKHKIIDAYKLEYAKSEQRLQNPYYAFALKNAGYNVPEKYLNMPSTEESISDSTEHEVPSSAQTNNSSSASSEPEKVKIKVKRKTK